MTDHMPPRSPLPVTAEKLRIATQALEAIENPLKHMRENVPEGHQLNGIWAVRLSESPAYLREIAATALGKIR